MSVYELNCLYAAKALFLVFVVAPLLFMLGISLVYAVSQFLGSIWNAIILHHFPILRCRKCRYWATVQCPLYGHSTPDDAGGADCGGEDADEEPEIYRPIPMEHPHGGEACPAATLKIQTGRQRKTAPGGLFFRLVYRINIRREVC